MQDGASVSGRKSAADHHLHPGPAGQQDAAGQSGAAQHPIHRQRLQDGLRPPSLGAAAAVRVCSCVSIFLLPVGRDDVTNVDDDVVFFLLQHISLAQFK